MPEPKPLDKPVSRRDFLGRIRKIGVGALAIQLLPWLTACKETSGQAMPIPSTSTPLPTNTLVPTVPNANTVTATTAATTPASLTDQTPQGTPTIDKSTPPITPAGTQTSTVAPPSKTPDRTATPTPAEINLAGTQPLPEGYYAENFIYIGDLRGAIGESPEGGYNLIGGKVVPGDGREHLIIIRYNKKPDEIIGRIIQKGKGEININAQQILVDMHGNIGFNTPRNLQNVIEGKEVGIAKTNTNFLTLWSNNPVE